MALKEDVLKRIKIQNDRKKCNTVQELFYFQKVSKTFGMLVQDNNTTGRWEINTTYFTWLSSPARRTAK